MKFICVLVACTPFVAAIRLIHQTPNHYPRTTAACGVVMVGAGTDKYVQKDFKAAQRIASLEVSKGWCAGDPELDHIPVVYFHDRINGSALASQALGSAKPLFEEFYFGSVHEPLMDNFEATPAKEGVHNYWKWIRPQIFMNSPFQTTLSMDGDALPCGSKLTEAFKVFAEKGAGIAAPRHWNGFNMGFVMFDKEKAKPMAQAWADQMKKCIQKKGFVKHDQPSAMAAMKKVEGGLSKAYFAGTNVCRDNTKGCASPDCWVDHRKSNKNMKDDDAPTQNVDFGKWGDSEHDSDDAAPQGHGQEEC